MANDIIDPGATSTTALTLEVEEETRRLLEAAADHEGRSLSSVLDDAVHVYLRSRSEGYQAYLEMARRFLDAPKGSDEQVLAGADLSAGLARDRGRTPQERGGAVAEVRARLRCRQAGGA
ncbi:MAG TPA: hypothetical protein VIJ28_19700 [Chloroflexota bacterium]|jgi:uncharacterized protein (DUF1778 family)